VYDLKLQSPTRLLRVATHGRGLWERLLDAPSTPDTNVYVRDNIMHAGRFAPPSGTPSPIENLTQHVAIGDPVFWWQCADVKIDALEGSSPAYQFPSRRSTSSCSRASSYTATPADAREPRLRPETHNRGIAAGCGVPKLGSAATMRRFAGGTEFVHPAR
jgi:hypothetical protein